MIEGSLLTTCSEYWGEGGRGGNSTFNFVGMCDELLEAFRLFTAVLQRLQKGSLPLIHHQLVYVDSHKVAFHSVLYTFPKVRQGEFL